MSGYVVQTYWGATLILIIFSEISRHFSAPQWKLNESYVYVSSCHYPRIPLLFIQATMWPSPCFVDMHGPVAWMKLGVTGSGNARE